MRTPLTCDPKVREELAHNLTVLMTLVPPERRTLQDRFILRAGFLLLKVTRDRT